MRGDDVTDKVPDELSPKETALRRAVLDRLDNLDEVVTGGEAEALLPVARDELHRLSVGFRLLLDEHRPNEDGRCRVCSGAWRTRRWPCSVWTTAHRQLLSHRSARPECGETAKPSPRTSRTDTDVPVLPTPIIASDDGDPGEWNVWSHSSADASREDTPTGTPYTPPVGGHLETDHTRIHRAAVTIRSVH